MLHGSYAALRTRTQRQWAFTTGIATLAVEDGVIQVRANDGNCPNATAVHNGGRRDVALRNVWVDAAIAVDVPASPAPSAWSLAQGSLLDHDNDDSNAAGSSSWPAVPGQWRHVDQWVFTAEGATIFVNGSNQTAGFAQHSSPVRCLTAPLRLAWLGYWIGFMLWMIRV